MPFPSSIPAVSTPTEASFKGHPVLTLPNPEDPSQPGLQFGLKKLRAIMAHESAVKAFVAKHYKAKVPAKDVAKVNALASLLRKMGASEAEIAAAVAA